jgi:fumarylacetoacetase
MTASQASWVTGARSADGEGRGEGFGLANLPMGAWSGEGRGARLGVRIGEDILDLFRCVESGVLRRLDQRIQDALARPVLNDHLALGPAAWSATRTELQRLLDASCPDLRDAAIAQDALLPAWGITMRLPCDIGDYTDFYASIHHATNVGSMFRPTNPLMPNWKHLPVGYHGRASTVVASGAAVRRPMGQTVQADDGPPSLTACRLLDYELELGAIVGGPANEIGQRVSVAEAAGRIYGHVLLNDWSARDLQKWEYQPLGPFTAKNFITSISPWVVSADALAPYRVPMPPRGDGDPQPLEYLRWDGDFLLDVRFEVAISSAPMRERGVPAMVVSRSRGTDLWWSMNQMLAHHTVSGCRMRAGDLIGSGTISGSGEDERGCLLELTWRGTKPITLPDGTERKFLQDGDEVILRGWAVREGLPKLSFGECRGIVLPVA